MSVFFFLASLGLVTCSCGHMAADGVGSLFSRPRAEQCPSHTCTTSALSVPLAVAHSAALSAGRGRGRAVSF